MASIPAERIIRELAGVSEATIDRICELMVPGPYSPGVDLRNALVGTPLQSFASATVDDMDAMHVFLTAVTWGILYGRHYPAPEET